MPISLTNTRTIGGASALASPCGMPLKVAVHPHLLTELVPDLEQPFSEDRAEQAYLMRAWRSRMLLVMEARRALVSSLGAAALRQAFIHTAGRSDIAHLPFRYKFRGREVQCTCSVHVNDAGTMHVDVSPWEGQAPWTVFTARELADRAAENRSRKPR